MRAGFCWAIVLSMFVGGCARFEESFPNSPLGYSFPDQYPASEYSRELILGDAGPSKDDRYIPSDVVRATARTALEELFPPPWTWLKEGLSEQQAKIRAGQRLYQEHCINCHGIAGAGDGPTAKYLDPRPRDFRRGVFKWKSTQYAAKPTRDDLLQIIRNGANGTSMAPYRMLSDAKLDQLVEYVVYLSKRGEFEFRSYRQLEETLADFVDPDDPELDEDEQLELDEELKDTLASVRKSLDHDWEVADTKIVRLPDQVAFMDIHSEEFQASVERGRILFLGDAGCKKCHGADGTANPSETKLEGKDAVDFWGQENPPRNLTLGLFRGGQRPIDLYRRVHEGIAGSAMSGLGATWSSPEQKQKMWDIVNLLRVLPLQEEMLAQPPAPDTARQDEAVGLDKSG